MLQIPQEMNRRKHGRFKQQHHKINKTTVTKIIALPSINLKIDSAATHHFHELGSRNLTQQPTSNYNPAAQVLVPDRASMVSIIITHIPIPYLPPSATNSYVFNHLSSIYCYFLSYKPSIIIALQFLTRIL